MSNIYKLFRDLIPTPALQVGIVQSVSGGVATIELPGGATVTARGSASFGQTVFFRDGVIEGGAPSLPLELIEV
jgi:hypothetical protein